MAAPTIGQRRRHLSATPVIDWGQELSQGLITVHVPNGPNVVDLVNDWNLDTTPAGGTQPQAGTKWGNGMVSDVAGNGAYLTVGTTHPLARDTGLTVMWVGTKDGTPTASACIYGAAHNNTGAAPIFSWMIGYDASGNFLLSWNVSGTASSVTGPAASDGPHVIVAQFPRAAIPTLWVDGTSATTGGTSVTTIQYASTAYVSMGYFASAARNPMVTTNFAAVWNRGLEKSEIKKLISVPTCLFAA